jgi:hypothetical protein
MMPAKSRRTTEHPADEKPAVAEQPAAATGPDGPRTATVNLPFVTAQFRAPQLHMPHVHMPSPPGRAEVAAAAQTARSFLPPPREAVYYGGLTLLAAFEVIEWPVAAAVGIGTALMARGRESGQQEGK